MMNDRTGKTYKKLTSALLLFAAAALVVCAASLSVRQNIAAGREGTLREPSGQTGTDYYTPKPVSSQEKAKETAAAPEEQYLVTVYEGKIGVYRRGDSTPFLLADVPVYLLPKEDILILRRGIRADSLQAVKSILEDYE